MVGITDIKEYASMVPSFTCKQLVDYFNKNNLPFSSNTTSSSIKRLQAKGFIEKICRGKYRLSSQSIGIFKPRFDKELKELSDQILENFPLIRFCTWTIEDLKRFSHYVVNMNVLFIDVERGCEETIFYFLLTLNLNRQVFLKPTEDEYSRYIRNKPTIVIRTLISEAPLLNSTDGTSQASLEKILVDSVIDNDFISFQEYESLRIFKNAFEACSINEKKMLRYAARRNHKSEIENIIHEIKQNEVFD